MSGSHGHHFSSKDHWPSFSSYHYYLGYYHAEIGILFCNPSRIALRTCWALLFTVDPEILYVFVESCTESWSEANTTYSTIALMYNYKEKRVDSVHEFVMMRID